MEGKCGGRRLPDEDGCGRDFDGSAFDDVVDLLREAVAGFVGAEESGQSFLAAHAHALGCFFEKRDCAAHGIFLGDLLRRHAPACIGYRV